MRLCTFAHSNGLPTLGAALSDDHLLDVHVAARSLGVSLPTDLSLRQLMGSESVVWEAVRGVVATASSSIDLADAVYARDSVTMAYPYRPTANIVKAGGNARKINGVEIPDAVELLRYHTKSPTACAPTGTVVMWRDSLTEQVYVEPQLVIAIGKPLYFAQPNEALESVVGYSVGLDFRAWDLMNKHGQWPKAVSLDGFFPWGPFLVTADEVADPDQLEVTLDLNGERILTASTADVLLSVGEFLSEVSAGMYLRPGDLFMLGLPEAVGFGQDPYRWCRDGDHLLGRISGVGEVAASVEIVGR